MITQDRAMTIYFRKWMTGMAHMPAARDCSGQGEPPYATVLENNDRETTPPGSMRRKG
jgi:hypothetical protein